MGSLARQVAASTVALPAVAAAQAAADGPATGASGWNWAIGVAAVVLVLAMAWDLFGGRRRARGTP